jgi:hypothetical protein
METSLHRSLKALYSARGSRTEAAVHGYRADVLQDGLVVEIQASPLGAIAPKVVDLLQHTRVLVVKPIVAKKFLLRRSATTRSWSNRRLSPKRGKLLDVFEDLVSFTRVFPHPNLTLEVLMVEEEELRVPRRRRRFRQPDFCVEDRRLLSVLTVHRFATARDLVAILPPGQPNPFTSETLAASLKVPCWFARKIAYTLRHCGAARVAGKQGNRLVYEWLCAVASTRDTMVAC